MLHDVNRPSLKMISVRNACNDAPPGAKKEMALKHLAAAEKARLGMSEAETNSELDAATLALA